MIVPDSSVLVAGFVPGHRFHEAALSALAEVRSSGSLIAHTTAETFAVLSGPGGIYRAKADAVVAYLGQFLQGSSPIQPRPGSYLEALGLLSDHGRSGGAIYDALIGLAARDAGAELVSLDGRAGRTYALCGVEVRLLVG